MLKKIRGLVLGLIVLAGSACVTPTHASSASIVITYVQAGGVAGALDEAVVLYNTTDQAIDITDWFVLNKSNAPIAYFERPSPTEARVLAAHGYVTIASSMKAQSSQMQDFSFVYTPVNQSSGSIVAGSDTISLYDVSGEVIDQHSWSSGLESGKAWFRKTNSEIPLSFIDTDQASDWHLAAWATLPSNGVQITPLYPQVDPPDPEPETPAEEVLVPLQVSELLPNAKGSDASAEYIELYNPNMSRELYLDSYTLLVGPNLEKSFTFPAGTSVPPGSYRTFYSSEILFTLANSTSRVALRIANGDVVSESPAYSDPPEATSWASIEGVWQYTNIPTPDLQNQPSLQDSLSGDGSGGVIQPAIQKPCADNQFRNPETGRCKLIALADEAPKACAANQERNPETGRCRLISVATTQKPCAVNQERNPETGRCRLLSSTTEGSAPCKEGQERNLETNRCRTIRSLAKVSGEVKGATQDSSGQQWYVWAAIGGVLLLATSYAVWEWRVELKSLYAKLRTRLAPRKQ